MKKLLLCYIIFFHTGGTYAQDRAPVKELGKMDSFDLREGFQRPTRVFDTGYIYGTGYVKSLADTIPALLMISLLKPQSICHTVDGYCVIERGFSGWYCIRHLDSRRRLYKPPVKVWACERGGGVL